MNDILGMEGVLLTRYKINQHTRDVADRTGLISIKINCWAINMDSQNSSKPTTYHTFLSNKICY